MRKDEIINSINHLVNTSGFTSEKKINQSYDKSTYSLNTQFKLELSNSELNDSIKKYSFKIDNINDIVPIWMEVNGLKDINKTKLLEDALLKFDINKNQDIYITLILI